jgi:hypothetical protein
MHCSIDPDPNLMKSNGTLIHPHITNCTTATGTTATIVFSQSGWTPQHYSIIGDHVEVFQHLEEFSASVGVSAEGKTLHKGDIPANHTSSSDIAAQKNDTSDQTSLLHIAVQVGALKVCKYLLSSKGFSVGDLDKVCLRR